MNVNDIAAKQESTLSHEDKLAYTSVFAAVAVAFNFFNFIFFSVSCHDTAAPSAGVKDSIPGSQKIVPCCW